MELKHEKYKQTDVGLIPSDWEVKSYEDVFTFLSTATYSRAELTELDEIKYIHYGDIHTKFHFHLDIKSNYLPSITQNKLKNYSLLKNGDLIMVDASEDYAGIGKSIEIKNLENTKVISGLHTFLFRDKADYFVDGYKGYIHSINVVKKQFDALATGMKVYGVSKNNLKKIFIPIPPHSEQTAIATALSDADNWINSLEKLITKKRLIKQGAMQELLQPNGDWEIKSLHDVVWFQEGPGVRNSQFTSSGVKLLNGTNIEKGKLLLEKTDRYISEMEAFGWYSHFLVNDEDILIACSGVTIDKFEEKVTIANSYHLPLCMNTSTMRFKIISNKLSKDFFYHFLKSKSFKEQIGGKATGSAQLNFGPSHVKMVNIIIPSFKEQTSIANILSDMDAEITLLEEKLEKAKQVKLGMMQELLTGKIRLV